MNLKLKTSFILLLLPYTSFAWFDQGHETIARIAKQELTTQTRKQVSLLLHVPFKNPGSLTLNQKMDTLALSASWADYLKVPFFRNTIQNDPYGPTCHFIEVTLTPEELTSSPQNQATLRAKIEKNSKGSARSAMTCTRKFIEVLKSDKETSEAKALALRYLIHVLGDLHQPLHTFSIASRESLAKTNRGGNDLKIPPVQLSTYPHYPKQPESVKNLHLLWDAAVGAFLQFQFHSIESEQDVITFHSHFEGAYAQSVANELLKDQKEVHKIKRSFYSKTTPPRLEAWAYETMRLGIDSAYQGLDKTSPTFFFEGKFLNSEEYQKLNQPLAKRQLLRAGLRLGALLNALFDPKRAPKPFVTWVSQASAHSNETTLRSEW